MPVLPEGSLCAAGAHDQADRDAGDHAVQVGASGRGAVKAVGGYKFAGAPDLVRRLSSRSETGGFQILEYPTASMYQQGPSDSMRSCR